MTALMTGPKDDRIEREKPHTADAAADGRQARLGQALRANLLKRKVKGKAKAKAGKASKSPPEEGGQAEG